MGIGVIELCGIAAAITAGVGGPLAVIRWCGSYVTGQVNEEAKDRAQAIAHLDGSIQSSITTITASITALDTRIGQTHGHKLANHASRLDALERLRSNDIERIVKVESSIAAIDKSLERVEHGQEKLAETINDRFDTLAESIREVRTVKPKD